MKNYNNIPTEDWTKYPDTTPNQPGYYLTTYLDNQKGGLFYKCVYWCDKDKEWIFWRNPDGSLPNIFEVGCFVEKTKSKHYTECLNKLRELYDITTC
jgi:hypothetical protein